MEATQPAAAATHSMSVGTSPLALPDEAAGEAAADGAAGGAAGGAADGAADGAEAGGLTAAEVGALGAAALRLECEKRGLESKRGTKQELKAQPHPQPQPQP